MDPDDDAAALRDRVDALEQTVSEQQATIDSQSSPTASRRGVLAALTGVAGAGALGAYSQRGAAQAAGQVGTSSEPVDVEAWGLNVQDALAGDLDGGGNDLTNVGAAEVENEDIAADGRPAPDTPSNAPLQIRSDFGRAIALQNVEDGGDNGLDRSTIEWITDAGETLAEMSADTTQNEVSIYGKSDVLGSGNTGTDKFVDFHLGPEWEVSWKPPIQRHIFAAQGVVRVGGGATWLYGSISNAISDIADGEKLILSNATYDPITVDADDVTIVGANQNSVRFDASDGTGIVLNGNRCTVRDVCVTASGAGNDGILINGYGCTVENAELRSVPNYHINVGADNVLLSSLRLSNPAGGSDSINFQTGTSGGLVNQCLNAGSIADPDGNNTIGTTT